MYIIKNAWANLHRNASRNLIMILIMIALIGSGSIFIIINTSANKMIAQYKNQFGAEVVITRDDNLLTKDPSQFMVPDKQLLDKLAESKLLKSVTKTMSSAVILDGIKTINEGNVPNGNGSIVKDGSSGAPEETDTNYISPNAIVFATTNPSISNEFKEGLRKIVEGEMYHNKNEAIISKKLAQANQITVGDILTVKVSSIDPHAQIDATLKIKITGLYDDFVKEEEAASLVALNTRANEIFLSYSSTEDSKVLADGLAQYDVYFTLRNPADLPILEKEFRTLGLPEYYQISMNDAMYHKIVGPVEGMADITKAFTIGIAVLGAMILIILSILSVRERKYEVGVLHAIGMKKHQVITGFLYESLFITAFALFIALGSAYFMAKPISSMVLNSQKNTVTEQSSFYVEKGLQVSEADVSEIEQLPIDFSSEAIMQIMILSFLLAFMASVSSTIYITRYEPIKILSERN